MFKSISFDIARRYLFGKKSTNAINIITGISVFGITIGTTALILVLSVFNGFEDLISTLFNSFNPPLKIVPAKGKVFEMDQSDLLYLQSIEEIAYLSETLEEVALLEYDGNQDFGTVKGVDTSWQDVVRINSGIKDGIFRLQNEEGTYFAVIGAGLAHKLAVNIDNPFEPIAVYMPNRKQQGALGKLFRSRYIYPSAVFSIQQDFDYQYMITSLDFARDLLKYDNELSSIEIRFKEGVDEDRIREEIQERLGDDYIVKDRYMQDEAILKLMNIEKWLAYAVLCLTLLLVAFNLIGSLWMIVLDKKKDIAILKAMGADAKTIKNIFLTEGLLICVSGIVIGIVLAVLFYLVQKTYGIVPIPEGFVVDAYPIRIKWSDFLIVSLTVLIIGYLASLAPSNRATKISAQLNEE